MIQEERTVHASTDRVWRLLSDLQRWDQVLPTMRQVSRLGPDGPVDVGARFEVHQPRLPRAVYEVTEWEPGSGFTWESSSPGVRTRASHGISALDGGARLVLSIEWTGPLAGLVRLLLGSKSRRMVGQEADAFVRLVEGDGQLG